MTDPVLHREVEERVAGMTIPPAATAGEVRYPSAGSVRDDGTRRAALVGRGREGRMRRALAFLVAFLLGVSVPLALPPRTAGYLASAVQQSRLWNSTWTGSSLPPRWLS